MPVAVLHHCTMHIILLYSDYLDFMKIINYCTVHAFNKLK